MATERTLSIIKPDGVERNLIGKILARFEGAGLRIVGCRLAQLSIDEAKRFYAEHEQRPFFGELTEFMCSSPVLVSVLEGEGAIGLNRKLMGATDPKDADPGTIRADYSESVGRNTIHGSDTPESAKREVAFFFPDLG